MVQPDFRGIDLVPMTGFAFLQQEIDTCARGPVFIVSNPSLAIPATFGMSFERQVVNDLGCSHGYGLGHRIILFSVAWVSPCSGNYTHKVYVLRHDFDDPF